jgi:hypothetical protein
MFDSIMQQRVEHLTALQADPTQLPYRFDRTHTVAAFLELE